MPADKKCEKKTNQYQALQKEEEEEKKKVK
jgi:hypothetical protein